MKRTVPMMLFLLILAYTAVAQTVSTVHFPDVPGYKTLKCDLHLHTVFSDGTVWPTFRVEEAWSEGLDAIAITDHLEYLPKKEFLKGDMNASVALAQTSAKELGLILIPGAEITRKMPPGHLNALFVKDANALVKPDWKDVVREAKDQGAIIMWNHPGWESQQPDGIARWYDEHTFLQSVGNFFGMEVVNTTEYYPEVLQWCVEKNLAVLGNSDSHDPVRTEYDPTKGAHRPLTLVFAKERTAEGIREALLEGRTVVYHKDELIGKEDQLRPLVQASLLWNKTEFAATGRERAFAMITNISDVPYELVLVKRDEELQLPKELRLEPGKSTVFSVRARKETTSIERQIKAVYSVKNCIVAPGKNLQLELPLDLRISPKK